MQIIARTIRVTRMNEKVVISTPQIVNICGSFRK